MASRNKRTFVPILVGLLVFGLYSGCSEQSPPTGPTPVIESSSGATGSCSPVAGSNSEALGQFAPDDEDFNCANVDKTNVRFGYPGYVELNRVGLYVKYEGVPAGPVRLYVWWNYENQSEARTEIILEDTDITGAGDKVDIEKLIEHVYTEVTEPTRRKVQVELVQDGESGNCARNRNVDLTPPPAEPATMRLVGSYQVTDGPNWWTNPPTYTCREACAFLFGGAAANYRCSIRATSITGTAWEDGWGDTSHCGGGTPVADDWMQSATYDCGSHGCSFSAYVRDHGCSSVNYCFK